MRRRPLLMGAGAVLTPVGLLWICQGLGYVEWPASSSSRPASARTR